MQDESFIKNYILKTCRYFARPPSLHYNHCVGIPSDAGYWKSTFTMDRAYYNQLISTLMLLFYFIIVCYWFSYFGILAYKLNETKNILFLALLMKFIKVWWFKFRETNIMIMNRWLDWRWVISQNLHVSLTHTGSQCWKNWQSLINIHFFLKYVPKNRIEVQMSSCDVVFFYFLVSLLAKYYWAQKLYFISSESAQSLYYTVNATLYQRRIDIVTTL